MPDNEGSTSLHLACLSGNNRVVKKLLLKGAKKKYLIIKDLFQVILPDKMNLLILIEYYRRR